MYASRFAEGSRFRPASMGAAIVINGGVVAALLLASPELIPRIVPDPPIQTIDILPEPKPLPKPTRAAEPRADRPQPQPTTPIAAPSPKVDVMTIRPIDFVGAEPAGNPTGTPTGTTESRSEPVVPPLFVTAREDPRYLADFQPPYPDYERDAGREDVVRLRVLIGIDGRVKQVERIGGRDSFARVATAHALAKWRFRPATRGGVPEDSWRVMTVRFQLNT